MDNPINYIEQFDFDILKNYYYFDGEEHIKMFDGLDSRNEIILKLGQKKLYYLSISLKFYHDLIQFNKLVIHTIKQRLFLVHLLFNVYWILIGIHLLMFIWIQILTYSNLV